MGIFTYKKKIEQIEESVSAVPIGSYGELVWKKFKHHKLAMMAAVILIFLFVFSFIGPFFTEVQYDDMDFMSMFAEPFSENHFLGSDELGHDVLVRLMYGGRVSLFVGLASSLLTTLIGTVVGLFSGYFGGMLDKLLMRFVDIMLSIPMFPILLILSLAFGSGVMNIVMILVTFGWMGPSRLIRGLTLTIRESEYVMAAKAMGVKNVQIIFKHVFPNVFPLMIVSATLNISMAILAESSLSYLGMGIQPPMPSWGNMLQGSMTYILGTGMGVTPWWLIFFPGLFIFLTVLNINFLGDGLRDALDPKFVSES